MEKIVIIGDIHTVTVFRLGGAEGVVSSPDTVEGDLAAAINRSDTGIVLMTRELAEHAGGSISYCNLNMVKPVIVEIPGINDPRGFGKSIMSYITEALGISI